MAHSAMPPPTVLWIFIVAVGMFEKALLHAGSATELDKVHNQESRFNNNLAS